MPVRQIQADEISRRRLREMRRRSHAAESAPRADGPYRTGRARCAHLVPEIAAQPHRPDAGHDAARSGADPVFRKLRRDRAWPHRPDLWPDDERRRVHGRPGRLWHGRVPANIGAEAIREMLSQIDLEAEADQLREDLAVATGELKPKKIIKRLKDRRELP